MSADMFKELSPYLNSLILAHEKGGIEGVEALVEGDTENKTGTIGTETEAVAKLYEGFNVNPFEQKIILSKYIYI